MQLIPDVSRTGIKHEQARDYQRTRRLGVAVLAELGTGDPIEAAAVKRLKNFNTAQRHAKRTKRRRDGTT